jgi:two-component system OmpR family sensor kinase
MIARLRQVWPLGLRAQLTIGYSVISTILAVIALALVGTIVRVTLLSGVQKSISLHASPIVSALAYKNGLCLQDPALKLPAPATTDALPYCPGVRPSPTAQPLTGYLVSIYAVMPSEKLVYASAGFNALNISRNTAVETLAADGFWETISISGSQHDAELLSTLVRQGATPIAVLQVARPIDEQPALLALANIWPMPGFFLAVILCVAGSYWLAKYVTRPIHHLTEAAQIVAGGDLRQRVPLPRARDDVQALAITFNEMMTRLEQSFAQQRRFVADASHELRTPVAVIRSMTDVALSGEPGREECLDLLREINAESERLSLLINALLGLARVDEGQMKLDCEPVQLDLVVADVVASVTPLAEERDLHVRTGSLEPVTVSADAARIIQLIMILVDNALAYTPAGGAIALSVTASGGDAHVAVTDTGIGIGPHDLPHIFERFYRADHARSRATGGSGLGLALAREIASAHSGTISVASAEGIGSTFTLSLPALQRGRIIDQRAMLPAEMASH